MNHAYFSMTNLGLLSKFLGIEISQSDIELNLHQSKYASNILKKLIMKDFKPSKTPFLPRVKLEEAQSTALENNTLYRKLVSWLLYLPHTQPDISYAVSVDSRHMHQPHEIQWRVANRILNFVQGTKTHGIHYVAQSSLELVGFTKSDWAGDKNDRK